MEYSNHKYDLWTKQLTKGTILSKKKKTFELLIYILNNLLFESDELKNFISEESVRYNPNFLDEKREFLLNEQREIIKSIILDAHALLSKDDSKKLRSFCFRLSQSKWTPILISQENQMRLEEIDNLKSETNELIKHFSKKKIKGK